MDSVVVWRDILFNYETRPNQNETRGETVRWSTLAMGWFMVYLAGLGSGIILGCVSHAVVRDPWMTAIVFGMGAIGGLFLLWASVRESEIKAIEELKSKSRGLLKQDCPNALALHILLFGSEEITEKDRDATLVFISQTKEQS